MSNTFIPKSNKTNEEIWEEAKEKIQQKMAVICFSTWVERSEITPVEIIEDVFILKMGVDNHFVLSILNDQYLGLFEKCISEVAGKKMRVKISLRESEKELKNKA